jgi:hypothetical protein
MRLRACIVSTLSSIITGASLYRKRNKVQRERPEPYREEFRGDCLIACTRAMLEHRNIFTSARELRDRMNCVDTGGSIDDAESVLCGYGLDCIQRVSAKEHFLLSDPFPSLVFVESETCNPHLIMLWERIGNKIIAMDPQRGWSELSHEELFSMLYLHEVTLPTEDIVLSLRGGEFHHHLALRMRAMGLTNEERKEILLERDSLPSIAALDAAIRELEGDLTEELITPGEAPTALRELCARALDWDFVSEVREERWTFRPITDTELIYCGVVAIVLA